MDLRDIWYNIQYYSIERILDRFNEMKFTIITASFNAGNKLHKTIHSVLRQTYQDYEIIIKDGQSTDGSVEMLVKDSEVASALASGKVRLFVQPDNGVYDGMNQGIRQAKGDYLLFLNCGDTLAGIDVLEKVAAKIEDTRKCHLSGGAQSDGILQVCDSNSGSIVDCAQILYGDTYCEQTGTIDAAPPKIDAFQCYRNLPCHQSTIYSRELFGERQYDTSLRVRADYDHFLWCYFIKQAPMINLQMTISSYEGGGISEDAKNEKLDREEHLAVVKRYLTDADIRKYQALMALTLAPVRKKIAESKKWSKVYRAVKHALYR